MGGATPDTFGVRHVHYLTAMFHRSTLAELHAFNVYLVFVYTLIKWYFKKTCRKKLNLK